MSYTITQIERIIDRYEEPVHFFGNTDGAVQEFYDAAPSIIRQLLDERVEMKRKVEALLNPAYDDSKYSLAVELLALFKE